MKQIPISVILASVVLFVFSAVTIYLHPLHCLAIAVVVLLAASIIRVAYFVIEGE